VCVVTNGKPSGLRNINMYNRLNSKISGDETSSDDNKTETTELSIAQASESYGSTPGKDESVSKIYVPFCAVVFYVLAFWGLFCSGLLRQGLSVAVVAMVNKSTVTETPSSVSDEEECPREPEVQRHAAGEFNWDRTQVGIMLAAYYYGYEVTQVCNINMTFHFHFISFYFISFH